MPQLEKLLAPPLIQIQWYPFSTAQGLRCSLCFAALPNTIRTFFLAEYFFRAFRRVRRQNNLDESAVVIIP